MTTTRPDTRAQKYAVITDSYRTIRHTVAETMRHAEDLADDMISLEPDQEQESKDAIGEACSVMENAVQAIRKAMGDQVSNRARSGDRRTRPEGDHGGSNIGTVQWFNRTKGYGFIAPDNGGKDVFVHMSVLERSGVREIVTDDRVTFEDTISDRGRSATRVELLGAEKVTTIG